MIQKLLTGLAVCAVVLATADCAASQERGTQGNDATTADTQTSAAFIKQLCANLGSPNARIRFVVRDALRGMGRQSMAALKAAKAAATDPHVQAFIERTIGYVKLRTFRPTKASRLKTNKEWASINRTRKRYDIDRIAKDINLTFPQIAELDPILDRHFKECDALWQTLRDTGATRDREAYKDVNDEIALMVQQAEPKLHRFLNEKQVKHVARLMRQRRYGGVSTSSQQVQKLRDMEMQLRVKQEAIRAKLEAQRRADEEAAERERKRR